MVYTNYPGRCRKGTTTPGSGAGGDDKANTRISGIAFEDRINNNAHYEPSNVRWASRSGQNSNKMAKDRGGENCPGAKLTWEQVREIRALKEASQTDLAFDYGVSRSCIRDILSGTTWHERPEEGE